MDHANASALVEQTQRPHAEIKRGAEMMKIALGKSRTGPVPPLSFTTCCPRSLNAPSLCSYCCIAESSHFPFWYRMNVHTSVDSVGVSSLPSMR